jgi:hypothetical protein
MKIERPNPKSWESDLESVDRHIATELAETLAGTKSRWVSNLAGECEARVLFSSSIAVDANMEWPKLLRLAARARAVHFFSAQNRGVASVEFWEGKHAPLGQLTDTSTLGIVNWQIALTRALTSRDALSLRWLVQASEDVVASRKPPSSRELHESLTLAAHKAVVAGDPKAEPLVHNAIEAARGPLKWVKRYYVDNFEIPRLQMLLAIHRKDSAAFNERLAASVELHHYERVHPMPERDPEDWWNSAGGLIDFDSLGFASLAHDRGLRIDVESDYIPGWLIRRAW